jgi:hypothetical protein
MTLPDWLGILGLVAGIVSIVLGIMAIWLSLHFYREAKGAEAAVSTALVDIRAQTATLERITARQLDRLTRFATQPRSQDSQVSELVLIFRQLTAVALAPPGSQPQADPLPEHVRAIYNVMYFAALANIGWNRQLLPAGERSSDDEWMVNLVDESHQFFFAHLHLLDGTPESIRRNAGILDKAMWVRNELVPHLRTSHTVDP